MFTIYDANHYHEAGLAALDVVLDYSKLTERAKNDTIRYIETGVITVKADYGAGRYATDLLEASGMFHLKCSSTASWRLLEWKSREPMPEPLVEPLAQFLVADSVAAALGARSKRGANSDTLTEERAVAALTRSPFGGRVQLYSTNKTTDILREIMRPYVRTEEYRNGVAAALHTVRTGGSLRFTVEKRKDH